MRDQSDKEGSILIKEKNNIDNILQSNGQFVILSQ